jgi:choice-of-anchor B domain-containing protein
MGMFDSAQYPELEQTACVDGLIEAVPGDAANTFRCQNVDLYHFLSHEALGDDQGEGSSSWGWTSEDGREFVAIGQYQGTAFVEIGADGRMSYLGRLPAYSQPSQWREIRSYKNYVVIGSEAQDHGIQVFDMTKLLDLDAASPTTFTQDDLTSWTRDLLPLGRAHNVVVNEELGYFAAVGGQPRNDPVCADGLNFFDISDPANLVSLGCAADDGYVHDAQCLVYRGPDARYDGRDICYGYNEDTLTIYDVTDKANVTNIISRISYEGASYTHQGWVLDTQDQRYLLLDDELDEENAAGPAAEGFPVTYIWDISDLENPKQTGFYKATNRGECDLLLFFFFFFFFFFTTHVFTERGLTFSSSGIDHNQYVVDGYVYQSNYGAGLRVYDVSSIPEDPTGASVCEAAFIDIHPEDDGSDGGGEVQFIGTWSSYAWFKSGFVFINSIERGGFVVKLTSKECA